MPVTIDGTEGVSGPVKLINNGSSNDHAVSRLQLNALLPAGAVSYFAMNTAPTGWLVANGAVVSRATYAALFAAIGTTFGAGDGVTTFRLPDLRGEFIRGWDGGRNVDTGRTFGSAQADELRSHTHALTFGATETSPAGPNGFSGQDFGASGATRATGGSETRPRNIALLACIKF